MGSRMALKAALGVAALVAALTTVAWRQATARDTLTRLEQVELQLTLAADEREELTRHLSLIEGRRWVVREASERIGLRPATDRELVYLLGMAR